MDTSMAVVVDVTKDVTVDEVVGVLVTGKDGATGEQMRDNLVDSIRDMAGKLWSEAHPDAALLTITLVCGGSVSYQTEDDIPLVDVPCPCGDSTHWLLKYEVD